MASMIKEELCQAFCGMLSVHEIPAGYAVGTGHEGMNGDHIGFYVIGPDVAGRYFVQDDGLTMATLEASGVDLTNKSRSAMLSELRSQYAVLFDQESGELKTDSVDEQDVGRVAMRFMAFMLRVQDLLLTTQERTLSTFREDASNLIRQMAGDRAQIVEDYVVSPLIPDVSAELAILAPNRPPVAVFFGIDDSHVMEALLLQSYAENKQVDCKVVALLETEGAVKGKTRQRANNHLTAVPNFRGDEAAACKRIVREALGLDPTVH